MADQHHSPIEYFRIFFRRKWFIIIPVFAGLVIGICAGLLMPKKYMSSTVILIEEGKTDNPLFSNIAVSSTVRQRMNTIRESMLGWNSLVQLVKRLRLDQDIKTTYQFEQLILSIRDRIIIRPRGANIIELAYVGDDPKMTQAVVQSITDIFIERNVNVQNQETADAISFIEEQLKVYLGKIKSAEIAALEDQLENLLIDSTDMHPRVRELRELIDKRKAELKEQNLEYTESVALAKETTNPLISEIKKALETMEGTVGAVAPGDEGQDLYKMMMLERLGTVVARDVKVNETIYNMLLQRLETAKITQRLQSSKEGTKYTIIDPPRIPLKPFKPNKLLVAFIGLIAGLGFGAGLVFVAEFLDKSFLDIHDAKEFLGQPLLGAIARINTEESIQEDRQRARWRIFWMLSAGLLVVVATLFVASYIG